MPMSWPRSTPTRDGRTGSRANPVDTREDVDRLHAKIQAAGHRLGQEPYDAFFGSRYAIVIDPDGNQVGLKSPIDGTRKYEPEYG